MFPSSYFSNWYYAPYYWANVGAAAAVVSVVTFEEAIHAYLTSSPYPLSAISDRWYIYRAPDRVAEPYGVIGCISPDPIHSHSGPSPLIVRDYQISLFSPSQIQAISLADSVRAVFDGFTGTMSGLIVVMLYRTEFYLYEEDTKLHHKALRFQVQYR